MTQQYKPPWGFARLSKMERLEMSSKGGKACAESPNKYIPLVEEARKYGRMGGRRKKTKE